VWDQINSDPMLGSTKLDFNKERPNNFMGEAERRKFEKLQTATKTHFFDG